MQNLKEQVQHIYQLWTEQEKNWHTQQVFDHVEYNLQHALHNWSPDADKVAVQ